MLDFCNFILILFFLLRNHVQSQQQKIKVWFGSSLRGGVAGGSVVASSLVAGVFWVVSDGFCWLRVTSDGFRWFVVFLVTSFSQHTEYLTLYSTHGHTWLTQVIRFFLLKVKQQEKKLLLSCRLTDYFLYCTVFYIS